MILLGATKQAAPAKESSAYCLRNEKQLLCVWGDSNAWHKRKDANSHYIYGGGTIFLKFGCNIQ